MKTEEIYNLAINKGIEADFRGREGVEKLLKRRKEKYDRLSGKEKEEFDLESFESPYSDSRVLNVSQDKEIKRILIGIDIEPAEILLAKEIGNIDLIISHHPLGKGLANLSGVMELQCDVLNQYGVPINIAEALMKERISEVARGLNAVNHQRTVDAARLLGFNLMCLHTVCDNLAARFLKEKIDASTDSASILNGSRRIDGSALLTINPERSRRVEKENNLTRIEDLLKLLKEIPEYKEAEKFGAGPKIYVGDKENRCGKIAITEITGGTEGSPKLYEKMAVAGIGTIIGMHMAEEHKKEAEAAHLNVVVAGHISSDSLGVNLFLDELEKRGIKIVPCSGLIRISRV